jgi:hypothetical protein
MNKEFTTDGVPTNTVMFDRICGGKGLHQGDRMALEFWNKLIDFSKGQNLLESNFVGRTKDNFHGCFWEIYLPKAFDLNGISLCRKGGGFPDFYFEKNGKKIWLEAVVCGEPEEMNIVPPPILDGEFKDGLAPEAQIMQRLANAISSKIVKFNELYSQKIKDSNNFYVIALNGYRGINNHPYDLCFKPPFIVKTLFGMGVYNRFYEGGKCVDDGFTFIRKTRKNAPIAHFTTSEYKNIVGVFYSKTSVWSCNMLKGEDFIFIQNPYATDLTDIFDFCKDGRWTRRELQPDKWRIEDLNVSSLQPSYKPQ